MISSYVKRNHGATLGEIFQPLYVLLSIFGLFPYNIHFNKAKKLYVLSQDFLFINLIPAACIICVITSSFVFETRKWLELRVLDFSSSNYFLQLVLLLSFSFFAYASAVINRKKHVDMLNMVASVWNEMPFCHTSQIPGRFKLEVNFVVMTGLLVITVVHLAVNFTKPQDLWDNILYFFTYTLMQLIQFVEIAHIYVMLLMVNSILQNIRENAQHYIEVKEVTTGNFWKDQKKFIPPTISQLEIAHAKAYDIISSINQAFQGPVLMITIQCFHGMVTLANIIYHEVVVKQNDASFEILNGCIWIFWQVLKLYILAHTGSLVEQEANNIGIALHHIPKKTEDFALLLEIQHFSTKMRFEEISLTVYGYFPVDATLLYNIVAAAMMYLTIFVQFDQQ